MRPAGGAGLADVPQEAGEVCRQGRLEAQGLSPDRMREAQQPGVECQAPRPPARMARLLGVVAVLAQNGIAGLGEMDADLVPATGLEADADEGGAGQTALDPVMGHGRLALALVVGRVALQTLAGDQPAREGPLVRRHDPGHQGDVLPLGAVCREVCPQRQRHLGGLGKHQQAGDLAVEAMHDLEAWRVTPALAQMAAQELHQRIAFTVQGGHGQHAGALLDDDHVLVVVYHRKAVAAFHKRLQCLRYPANAAAGAAAEPLPSASAAPWRTRVSRAWRTPRKSSSRS